MLDTKLEVGCEFNNCTSVSSPGANIASPIAMSLFGILGQLIWPQLPYAYSLCEPIAPFSSIWQLKLSKMEQEFSLSFILCITSDGDCISKKPKLFPRKIHFQL